MKILSILSILWAITSPATTTSRHRQSRHLVYPTNGSKVQFIIGFGIPVELPHQAVTIGYVIKSNYLTPTNGTQYTRPFDAFTKRDLSTKSSEGFASRWALYAVIENAVVQLGAKEGRQCLLRAVCESAVTNLQHDGLIGELLHVILTPSSTSESVLSHRDYEFHAAERIGRKARSEPDPYRACTQMFPACATGALDLFSKLLPI